jgi:hypothetical protein
MRDRTGSGEVVVCVLVVVAAMFLAFVLGRVSVNEARIQREAFAAGMAAMAEAASKGCGKE